MANMYHMDPSSDKDMWESELLFQTIAFFSFSLVSPPGMGILALQSEIELVLPALEAQNNFFFKIYLFI